MEFIIDMGDSRAFDFSASTAHASVTNQDYYSLWAESTEQSVIGTAIYEED